MSGDEAEARAKSDNEVVIIGGFGFGGDTGGGLGGGSNGGGGGDGRYGKYNRQVTKWVGYRGKHNLRDRA